MTNVALWLIFAFQFISVAISVFRTILAWKQFKESKKDEIWETTLKLLCNSQSGYVSCEDFVETYEKLKAFRDNGCKIENMPHVTDTKNKPIFTSKEDT